MLYGIVTQEIPHRLAWFINQHNPFAFARIDDYELELNGLLVSFACFEFKHEENHTTYLLLNNKDDGQYLLPDLKNCDYLLIIKGAIDFFEEQPLKELFRQIPTVQFIYATDPDKLKSKTNLMYL